MTHATPKSYKREVALLTLLAWAGCAVWAVYEPAAMQVASMSVWPVFALVAAAFGMQSLATQFGSRG